MFAVFSKTKLCWKKWGFQGPKLINMGTGYVGIHCQLWPPLAFGLAFPGLAFGLAFPGLAFDLATPGSFEGIKTRYTPDARMVTRCPH